MRRFIIVLLATALMSPFTALALQPNDDGIGFQLKDFQLINLDDAWEIETGNNRVVIAVIDDGIDMLHQDLDDNIWMNIYEIPGNGIDDDENGYIDDYYGWEFSVSYYGPIEDLDHTPGVIKDSTIEEIDAVLEAVGLTFDDLPEEGKREYLRALYYNHGTPVASVIGAEGNNGSDLSGVMWDVSLMNLPMFELSEAYEDTIGGLPPQSELKIAEAVEYAVTNGAHIINMSIGIAGGPTDYPFLEDALKYAYDNGVLVVAAAGNEGQDTGINPSMPACSAYVLTVGSVNALTRNRSFFSNYGECVDVYAPGDDISMLYFGLDWNEESQEVYETNEWIEPSGRSVPKQVADGTSFSAPMVAGLAGLLKAQYPFSSGSDLARRIIDSQYLNIQSPLGSGKIVDAERALTMGPLGPQYADGTLLQDSGQGDVYYLEDGFLYVVPDEATFNAKRFSWADVQPVNYPDLIAAWSGLQFIEEGAIIRAEDTFDVYIVKYVGGKLYKRLVLSPSVFNSYGHLRWEDIQDFPQSTLDFFPTADLVRVAGDSQIYKLIPQGDTGIRQPISDAVLARLGLDADSIYEINTVDRESYAIGDAIN